MNFRSAQTHHGRVPKRIVSLARTLWWTVQVVLFVTSAHAAAPPLILDAQPSESLAGHLEQFIDPSGHMTLADVLAPDNAAKFVPLAGNMNQGYTRDTVWLRCTLRRTDKFESEAYLSLWPPYLDFLAVFLQKNGHPGDVNAYQEWLVGDNVPALDDEIRSMNYVLPVILAQSNTDYTLYVRIKSSSTVTLVGNIHNSSSIIYHEHISILFNGGYLFVMILMALINILFYIRISDKIYLRFSFYVFSLFIVQFGTIGVLKICMPKYNHLISDYVVGWGFGLSGCTLALFMIALFKMQPGQWSRRFFCGVFFLGSLTILSVPAGQYGLAAGALSASMIVTIVLLTALSIGAVRRGDPQGWLYLVAFGVSNVGYGAQLMRLHGIIPAMWWNQSPVQIATLINVVLMTLALTERLRSAEHKALIAAQEAEHKAVELAKGMTAELRAALDKEHQIMRRLIRFLSMLSHEYRTPLAVIQANVDVMALETPADTPTGRKLCSMRHAVHRLVELLEVSLREERLSNFHSAPKRVPVDVTALLDEVLDRAEAYWPERNFVFTPPESGDVLICGDPVQLRTAVLNLLDNAHKYSPNTAPILIHCDCNHEYVAVNVTDYGLGCTTGDIDTLFEKYQRGANSQGIGGAGLGLWIVRQIVEQHGGSITLSMHDQGGTRATLTLPLPTPDTLCSELRSAPEKKE